MKKHLFNHIDKIKNDMFSMSDYIFDNPEIGYKEYKACKILTEYLSKNNFRIEKIQGLETAFKAIYESKTEGPSIGLLCEYDALEDIGHACGHHMQGPAIIAAAVALKEILKDYAFKLVVYGTPAEETGGGKIDMIEKSCFKDIDIALMFHASQTTTADVKTMTLSNFIVKFKGKSVHAAIQPEKGRSALDGLLLAFNGVEFLREHVKEDTRIHYNVTYGGGPNNVVPPEAEGTFCLRSYNRKYLNEVIDRFRDIIHGAALMTGTAYEIIEEKPFNNKIPVYKLNDLLMANARLVNAPRISPPREKTGSTDFGNITYMIPGSCIRVSFVSEHAPVHSQEFLDAGKSESAHNAIVYAAKILAASSYDLIKDKELLKDIKEEFKNNKSEEE